MNFLDFPFFLSGCLVRTKGNPKDKSQHHTHRALSILLPFLPQPLTPKRDLPPYEYPLPSGRPSRFTQLPVELILLIVEYVDLFQRARLTSTCRYFRSTLEPTLYRHLNLLDPELCDRGDRIYKALAEKPSLISQTVTYHGPIFPKDDGVPWTQVDEDPRWSKVLSLFRNAVNIQDLHFTDEINWIGGYPWALHRKAVDNMVLDRLVIQIPDESVDLVPLLRNQPELTRLELRRGGRGWENLEATDIPKLRSLSATQQIALLTAPGRPVDEINILPSRGAGRLREEILLPLSKSTRPIQKFGMKLYCPSSKDAVRDELRALARHLPAIKDLTITVGWNIWSEMLLSEIPAFGSLSSLTLLDASLVHFPFSTTSPVDEELLWTYELLCNDTDTPDSWADLETRLKKSCPNFTSLRNTEA